MIHLGCNIYHWGHDEQIRLLTEGLGPMARTLREAGLARRFWTCRFDARGPHVLALLTTTDSAVDELERALRSSLDHYLEQHPSTTELATESLRALHEGCRGKTLSIADREPGFAANNTYILFRHPPDGYPFGHTRGIEGEDALWRQLDTVTFWTIAQLAARRQTMAALRLMASVDAALRSAGLDAEGYWRFHASTLLVHLETRLATEPEKVYESLPAAVSERNRAIFDQVWRAPPPPSDAVPDIDRVVSLATADRRPGSRSPWSLLRELTHIILGQLAQPVNAHIPMVLYAWHRNRTLRSDG